MRSNKISLKKYVINKGLTKAPDEYSDANSQPHVQVRPAAILRHRFKEQLAALGPSIHPSSPCKSPPTLAAAPPGPHPSLHRRFKRPFQCGYTCAGRS